ncbi:MAG: type II toxin-antitoxin system RelE family toxin [Candidatus Sumerlaeaceae bacterium]
MDHLPSSVFQRVSAAILVLETDPRPAGTRKLRGLEQYRIRVGEYRILYTVHDGARRVDIVAVAHRSEAYRRG